MEDQKNFKVKNSDCTPVVELMIYLWESDPDVYRHFLVPFTISLPLLHEVIQIVMGWGNGYPHRFIKGGRRFFTPSPQMLDGKKYEDERNYTLEELAPSMRSHFSYEYLFDGCWIHEIYIEKLVQLDEPLRHPICIEGKGGFPPRNWPAIDGYHHLLEIFMDPHHEAYKRVVRLVKNEYRIQRFRRAEVNKQLKSIAFF